jgi:hypothetical protein
MEFGDNNGFNNLLYTINMHPKNGTLSINKHICIFNCIRLAFYGILSVGRCMS